LPCRGSEVGEFAAGNTLAKVRDIRYLLEGVSRELVEIDVSGETDIPLACVRRPGCIPAIEVGLFRRQHIEGGLAFSNKAEVHHRLDVTGVPSVVANQWMRETAFDPLQRSRL
jgi:hypothetical protein